MSKPKINTLGELKKTEYQPIKIQQELSKNLRYKLKNGLKSLYSWYKENQSN